MQGRRKVWNLGASSNVRDIICPSLVGIGLSYLQKSRGWGTIVSPDPSSSYGPEMLQRNWWWVLPTRLLRNSILDQFWHFRLQFDSHALLLASSLSLLHKDAFSQIVVRFYLLITWKMISWIISYQSDTTLLLQKSLHKPCGCFPTKT